MELCYYLVSKNTNTEIFKSCHLVKNKGET